MMRSMLVDESETAKTDLSEIQRIREILNPVLANRFFHFERPRGIDWVGIVIGSLMSILFYFILFTEVYTREDLLISLNIFSYLFFFIFGTWIAYSFPTGIGMAIRRLSGRKMSGITVSYREGPNGEKTESSQGKEGEGWLVNPPEIEHWHLDEPYREDDAGLLAEHPMNIGTPIPALFTVKSIITLLKNILLSIAGVLLFIETDESMALIPILALGFLGLLINYNRIMKWQKMVDLPTSTIRGAAVGRLEVFGQLRPRKSWPPTIFVDNDPSKELFGMGIWSWEYFHLFSWDELVDEIDHKGDVVGVKWERRVSKTLIRANSGGYPIMVHDGTSGIALQDGILSGGKSIKSWSVPDESLFGGRKPQGDHIRNAKAEHYWIGSGWPVGEPLFVSGYASIRDSASLEAENVDRTEASALLEIGMEGSSIGHAVEIKRGGELLVLQHMESGLAALLPSLCMILITGIPLLQWLL